MRILGWVIGEGFGQVLAEARNGNEVAFSRLWRDVNPGLLRYVRVLAPQAAEDIAAEAWVDVVRGLRRFRGDEAAWRAWVFTTARRRVIDASRRSARQPHASLHVVPAEQLPGCVDAADEVLERLDTEAALALLLRLPRLQAEVILLRVVAGLDTGAVARLVGRNPGAVRVAAHRGLRRLAEILAGAGVTL
jgi:RNA polymerase sigma-70 factor (ECF subfamily)